MEKDFLESGGEWKKFKLSELFIKQTIKGVPKKDENLEVNENGYHMFGQNIKYQYPQKILLDNKYLQVVEKEKPILAYTSSASEIGMIEESFYRSGDNGAFQGLFPRFKNYNKKHMLYILTLLQKHFINFGYSTSMSDVINLEITLPFLNNKIYFSYMEKYIDELEALYIDELETLFNAELEAYLVSTGLNDYHLTKYDKKIIDNFNGLITSKTDKIRLGDIFDIKPTKSYKLTNEKLYDKEGNTPVISNTAFNNGVGGYSKLKATEKGNIITYSDTTTDNNIFYQPNDFIGYSHVQGLYPLDEALSNKDRLIYIQTCFKVSARGKFDYANKFNRENANNILIELPINNENIDFKFMENFIKVIEKLVIKDVVDYKNMKIEAIKKIVQKK